MPPHKGHVYAIDFASKYVDELYVVVDRLKDEPIPQALRVKWLQAIFPNVKVVPLGDFNPQDPSESESAEIFWRTWERSLKSALPEDIDFVFGSEEYCWELAKRMGAIYVPVDSSRSNFPMCATDIRKDPLGRWDYLPDVVKPYFLKKICIIGAESTGKSVLSEKLAEYFNTIAVPEYAKTFLQSLAIRKEPRSTQYEDIEIFAKGQIASEDAMSTLANRILISDTDVLTTHVWSQTLYGKSPDFFHQMIDKRRYDLYIVANTDVEWKPDIHRQWEDEAKSNRRRAFEHRLKAELLARDKPFIEINTGE
jgi:NadR type nicotinamide-nucleotide adenylyltransferase